MRRLSRSLLTTLLTPVLLLGVLLALLWLGANTDAGRRLIVWGVAEASGGRVLVSGLGGQLPFAPRIEGLRLGDGSGIWLTLDGAALDVDPWGLLHGELAIESLTARSLVLKSLPETTGDGGALALPLRVLVRHLAIAEVRLDGAVPGAPPLAVEASGALADAGTDGGRLKARVQANAPGRADRYSLEAENAEGRWRLGFSLREGPGGLIGALLGADLGGGLGDLRLEGRAEGPASALDLHGTLAAGPLDGRVDGVLDLETRSASRLAVFVRASAMSLAPWGRPGIAWRRLAVAADLHGSLTAPQGEARLELEGFASGDLGLDRLSAELRGDASSLSLAAELGGIRGVGPLPDAAAAAPLRVEARTTLAEPALPFRLAARHPLVHLKAEGGIADRTARATLHLPDLAALAVPAGLPLAGGARLEIQVDGADAPRLDGSGELRLTQAPGPVLDLLGPVARVALSVRRDGAAWRIPSAQLEGRGVQAGARGWAAGDALAFDWTLDLPDLGVLAPDWTGRGEATGRLAGSPAAPELAANLRLDARHPRAGGGRISGRLLAEPVEPAGALDLGGEWAGQPVAVSLGLRRSADGALALAIADGRLGGVAAAGSLTLPPGASLPHGTIRLRAERLADLAPLLMPGSPAALGGRLRADLTLTERGDALIEGQGDGLVLPGAVQIGALALSARVVDPLGRAETRGTLGLRRVAAGALAGDLDGSAAGPGRALDLTASAGLILAGAPASLELSGAADVPARRLKLRRLEARSRGETLRLLAPAVLNLNNGVTVDRLRLGLGGGSVELAGRASPKLDLSASVSKLPLDLVRLVSDLPLTGILEGRARLTGTADALAGTLSAQARGLRLTEGPGRSVPPAAISLSARLGPGGSTIEARAEAGSRGQLRLSGRIGGTLPGAPGPLDLRADGRLDLALLDPLLTGGGRQASGQAVLATAIAGTLAAPRLDGTLRLSDTALRDRTLGLSLTGIGGTLRLAGERVRLEGLAGRAGRGSVALDGEIGALAPGMPVDLRLVARNARPVQLDLVEAEGDADVRLAGRLAERASLTGSVRLARVDARLPERLPAGVATLEVQERGETRRRRGEPRRAFGSASLNLGLDLKVSAPRAVFVRGRGLEAELGGAIGLGGTLADPDLLGGLTLLGGEYDLAGERLRFSRGRIDFDGSRGLDPSLDLEARASVADATAILSVQGTVRAPRIVLRSEPELPEDEILSRLLFGVSGGRVSGLQAARLAMAAASLAGLGREGPGAMERARTGLGLDRLSAGSDSRGDGILEGGRYLVEGIYLGARQALRVGETQGVLRMELTPQLRLEADVGVIGGTRAGAAFEREY